MAGRKRLLPLLAVKSLPYTPFWVIQVLVVLSINSCHWYIVGVHQPLPQLAVAASSSGKRVVRLSVKPL